MSQYLGLLKWVGRDQQSLTLFNVNKLTWFDFTMLCFAVRFYSVLDSFFICSSLISPRRASIIYGVYVQSDALFLYLSFHPGPVSLSGLLLTTATPFSLAYHNPDPLESVFGSSSYGTSSVCNLYKGPISSLDRSDLLVPNSVVHYFNRSIARRHIRKDITAR